MIQKAHVTRGICTKVEIVSCRQQSQQCSQDRIIQLEIEITFPLPTARRDQPHQTEWKKYSHNTSLSSEILSNVAFHCQTIANFMSIKFILPFSFFFWPGLVTAVTTECVLL